MKTVYLVLLVGLLSACGPDQSAKVAPAILTLEHKFAIVNVGHELPSTDPVVARSAELLTRASEQYAESEESIADMSIKASNLIKKEGVDVSALEVLEATALVYTESGSDYATNASMYVMMRKSGEPHAEAMMALRAVLNLAEKYSKAN